MKLYLFIRLLFFLTILLVSCRLSLTSTTYPPEIAPTRTRMGTNQSATPTPDPYQATLHANQTQSAANFATIAAKQTNAAETSFTETSQATTDITTYTQTPIPSQILSPTSTSTIGPEANTFMNDPTTRVSVASDEMQGNEASVANSISEDGRYVVFTSWASNLADGDTKPCFIFNENQCPGVFVHDRETGETSRVSVASDGTQGNERSVGGSISANGRYVAFTSWASNIVAGDTNICLLINNPGQCPDVFVHDRETGETTRVSVASGGAQANDASFLSQISADGRYVVFESRASTLVTDDTNDAMDIFVHDRETGETIRVSVASGGAQANQWSWLSSISADGRLIAFASHAENLVNGDTNGNEDIFIHDRKTGETTRVSVASDGTQGNSVSSSPSISSDGRYVAFESLASNLIAGDTNGDYDVFVHDRETGETTRVSVASDGTQGNSVSSSPSISSDGRYVAFTSWASNLIAGDTNNFCDYDGDNHPDHCPDVFIHDSN